MQHLVFLVKSPCATAAIVCVISQWVEIITDVTFFHISKSNKAGKAFSPIGCPLNDKFIYFYFLTTDDCLTTN